MYARKMKDFSQIRDKYGGDKGMVAEIYLEDVELPIYVWIDEDGIHFKVRKGDLKPEGYVITTADTILNIFDGRLKVIQKKTNAVKLIPYNFKRAYQMGDVKTKGNVTTNVAMIIMDVFDRYIEDFRDKFGDLRKEMTDDL
ncbi:unnamed protein product [marine sediment metagenome]|uniref:Uncharacterized protein n=1 Tax=marine sediment metagenome TaxID=412755 RepID=X1BL77_9ZZZZ